MDASKQNTRQMQALTNQKEEEKLREKMEKKEGKKRERWYPRDEGRTQPKPRSKTETETWIYKVAIRTGYGTIRISTLFIISYMANGSLTPAVRAERRLRQVSPHVR